MSQLTNCLDAVPDFLLSQDDAKAFIAHQISVVLEREAELATVGGQQLRRG